MFVVTPRPCLQFDGKEVVQVALAAARARGGALYGPLILGRRVPRPRPLPSLPPKIHITPVDVIAAVCWNRAAGRASEGMISAQAGLPAWRTKVAVTVSNRNLNATDCSMSQHVQVPLLPIAKCKMLFSFAWLDMGSGLCFDRGGGGGGSGATGEQVGLSPCPLFEIPCTPFRILMCGPGAPEPLAQPVPPAPFPGLHPAIHPVKATQGLVPRVASQLTSRRLAVLSCLTQRSKAGSWASSSRQPISPRDSLCTTHSSSTRSCNLDSQPKTINSARWLQLTSALISPLESHIQA